MPFLEVADRVWVLRHAWLDLNITAVGGERGMVVVDTHGSSVAAAEVITDLRRLSSTTPVAIVNTHEHFDHTFGNAAFLQEYGELPIHATDEAAERTVAAGERMQQEYRTIEDPRAPEVLATTIRPADQTFSSAAVIDLGDRQLELVHPGRGHTGGDLVVRIPDVDVLLAGDLIEESAPPAYGLDSWPMDWPGTLDLVLGLLTGSSVVVPGHGAIVDRRFVEEQADDVRAVAETLRNLVGRGVAETDAQGGAEWPFPAEALKHAITRGYAQLPPARRNLPMA